MDNVDQVLSQLRDIHTPESVPWWPLGLGWWLSLLFILLSMLILLLVYKKNNKPTRRLARKAILPIVRDYEISHDKGKALSALSAFLRQVAINVDRREYASSTGVQWMKQLDALSGFKIFESGSGAVLLDAQYRPVDDINVDGLIVDIQAWVDKLKC